MRQMSGSVAPQSSGQLQEDNLQYQLQEVQISRPVVQVETNDGNRQHRTHVSRPGVVTEEKYPRRRGKEELEAIAIADVKEAIEIDNQRWRLRAKIIFGVLLVGVVTAAIVDLVCHDNVQNWLDLCFDWIEENPEAGERMGGYVVQKCNFCGWSSSAFSRAFLLESDITIDHLLFCLVLGQ